MKRTILIVLIIICSFLVGMGLWYARVRMLGTNTTKSSATSKNSPAVNASVMTSNNASPAPTITTKPPKNQPLDSDHDGLIDEEEKTAGTDLVKADTDGDGLTDRQEVVVFRTDPLNGDTDGNGVKDGDEVRSGTDPNGSGNLLDLQQALRNQQP